MRAGAALSIALLWPTLALGRKASRRSICEEKGTAQVGVPPVEAAACAGGTCERRLPSLPGDQQDDAATARYLRTCREYGIKPSADVLNRLELGLGDFLIQPTGEEKFGNLDFRAFVKLLEDEGGKNLRGLAKLDLSRSTLSTSSILLVARMIRHPQCCVESLDISYQEVGPTGILALADAIQETQTVRVLRMHSCALGDEGGQVLAKLIRNRSAHTFEEIDIQNNFIDFETCTELDQLARDQHIKLSLSGNRVHDEVINSVTHGIGEIFVVLGSFILALDVSHKPRYYKFACAAYCISLNVLYLSSTLFHAFFALGHTTVYIFGVLDYSGIFLLIAGSYSPFLLILFPREAWAQAFFVGMWTVAFLGISMAAFYRGPFATPMRLSLFLTMGWAVVFVGGRIVRELGLRGTTLLVAGGVLYTAGVPWFVRNRHTLGWPDHGIWHLFVMAASLTHFLCIYWYVASRPATVGTASDKAQALLHGSDSDSEGDALKP